MPERYPKHTEELISLGRKIGIGPRTYPKEDYLYPRESYVMPDESEEFAADWWIIADAARAWGVTWGAAARIFDRHEDDLPVSLIELEYPNTLRLRRCVPAGTQKPPDKAGNRLFASSSFQAEMAQRRWRKLRPGPGSPPPPVEP